VADALVLALDKHHSETPINISSGKSTSIKELSEIVKEVVGYEGEIEFDATRPSGQQVKIFNVERMENILGFTPKVGLKEGIAKTYSWFISNLGTDKIRL
jgi:GDP-L-fucose synthase